MSPIKKVETRKKVSHKRKTIGLNLSLPTKRSVPSKNLEDYTNLFFGKKKIGKTTLSSRFPNAIHFMFESGSKALAIYSRLCPTWEHFIGFITLLETQKHTFKNVVIDTGAIAYDRCLEFVCNREGVNHPSDIKDYGANWKKISQEFERAHTRIEALGLGLIVIAHEKTKEIETMSGQTFDVIVPALSGQAEEYYAGSIDNIFYYHYTGRERFLTIKGDELIVAGTRCEDNFFTVGKKPIYKIPMGKNSTESYNNLLAAFRNEQVNSYEPKVERKEEKKSSKNRKTFKK